MAPYDVIYTNQVGNQWCPQLRFEAWVTSEDDKYVYFDWYMYYDAHGYAAYTNGNSRKIVGKVGGGTYERWYNINGVSNSVRVATGSDWLYKDKGTRWVPMEVSFGFDVTWNGSYAGTTYGSGGFSIPPMTSYTVSYNANGGSGVPGNQTKWYDENITISNTKPTRTGHSFQGWATSSSGSVAYKPGATYSANSGVTLYAVWKADTYPVTYDANGGTGAPESQTKTYGETLKLSATEPIRKNYNFLGWGTSASSTTVAYSPGADYTGNTALALYAIWELAYVPPKIENITIDRCQSDGTLDDFGTNIKVVFSWVCDQTIGLNEVSEITIEYKKAIDPVYTKIIVPATGINGSVSEIVGNDEISIEDAYDVTVSVRDSKDATLNGRTIPSAKFTMDFKMGGDGVAFGEPASLPGFHVNMHSYFKEPVHMKEFMLEQGGTIYTEGSPDEGVPQAMPFITTNAEGKATFQTYALAHQAWLQARLASGNATNLLRINADNQVEFNWTKGGPRGRIRKTIWEGTTGDEGQIITIPEQMYYNFFLITHGDRLYGKIPAFRENPGGAGSYITGATIIGNTKEQYGAFVRFQSISETQWKVISSTTNGISHDQNSLWPGITLTKIEGVL